MTQKEYNGWTNYETWNVALWIGNEEGSSRYWNDQAQQAWDDTGSTGTLSHPESARFQLADAIKESFEDREQEILDAARAQSSVWADLLGAALSEVNWDEIAAYLLENVEKGETADTEPA